MVFKRLINSSSKEGESRGETVNNCEYVDNFPSRTTLNTLRKRLTFSRKDHNIILRQFGAWLTIYTEEPFGCLLVKIVLPNCTRREPVKEIEVSDIYRTVSHEAQVWCENYGLVQKAYHLQSLLQKRKEVQLCLY